MIGSLLKAIDILQVFTSEEPRLSLAEISKRLGMPKTTTHNLLNTMLSRGLIEKTDDGDYALGTAIIPLTQAVRANVELRDRAAPLLRQLADECRNSVYLGILDGDHVLYIYAVESPQRLRARTAVGDRVHLHCTSVGKAILAALPSEEVHGVVTSAGMPKFTENTIVELDALLGDLEITRQRGYSFDLCEHEAGLYCVGATIFDSRGRVAGACSVSGPDPEIVGGRLSDISSHLLFTAEEISRRMGYVPARLSAVAAIPTIQ